MSDTSVTGAYDKDRFKGMDLPERMIEIRRDTRVAYAQKTKEGTDGSNRFLITLYDEIVASVRALLNEAEIMVWPTTIVGSYKKEGKLTSLGMAISFEYGAKERTVEYYGEGMDGGDKGANKAYTYAMKNCLLKTFLIETGENEEAISFTEDNHTAISAGDLVGLQTLMKKADTETELFVKYLNGEKGLNMKSLAELPSNYLPFANAKLNIKIDKAES